MLVDLIRQENDLQKKIKEIVIFKILWPDMQNKENKIKIGYIDTLIFRVGFPNKAKKL